MSGLLPTRQLDRDERWALRVATLKAVQLAPYLATAIHAMQAVACPGLGTFAVDRRWRLLVDVEHAERSWTVEAQAAVLVHEVHHLIRDHHGRAERLGVDDPERWNVAGDAAINDDLADLALPTGAVTSAALRLPRGRTVEEYYARLDGHCGRPGGGGGEEADARCGDGAGGPPVAALDDDGSVPGLGAAEVALVRRRVARDIAHSRPADGRGRVPAGLRRWADAELSPPTVPWRQLLAGTIRAGLRDTSGQVDHSYRRPSRRRIPGVVLPAMVRPRPSLVTVLDTSASMGRAELLAALSEVEGICRQAGIRGPEHRIICVDADAAVPRLVRRAADVELRGGGGTDMGVGIAAAVAVRPRPEVVVVLTDGHTPWPAERPRGVRVVIGIVGPDRHTPDVPGWARRVDIEVASCGA